MNTTNLSPAALRAEADRLENYPHRHQTGTVYIMKGNGCPFVHRGTAADSLHIDLCGNSYRRANESDFTALCIIPEFKAYLEKVREG